MPLSPLPVETSDFPQGLNLSSGQELLVAPLSLCLAFILIGLDHIRPFIGLNSTD